MESRITCGVPGISAVSCPSGNLVYVNIDQKSSFSFSGFDRGISTSFSKNALKLNTLNAKAKVRLTNRERTCDNHDGILPQSAVTGADGCFSSIEPLEDRQIELKGIYAVTPSKRLSVFSPDTERKGVRVPRKSSRETSARAILKIDNATGKSQLTPTGTHIIAFANFKGGVGKTTCAVNVAGSLAYNFNKKVLLVDLDVQSSFGQWLMGAEWWHNWSKHRSKTSYQIFLDIINGSHAWSIDHSTFAHPSCPNLRVCPATFDMLDLDTQLHHGLARPLHPKPFQCLDIQIKRVCSQFQYVILDCPPNMYMTTKNALFCADHVIIPTLPDFLSTAGLKRLVGFLKELRDQFLLYDSAPIKIAGIVINMFDQKKKLMKETIEDLEAYIEENKHTADVFLKKAKVFGQRIRNLNDMAKAQDERKPVNIAFPTSEASRDFIQLTDQIMGVM